MVEPMGSRYKTICKNCHHQFSLSKGGGWTWYEKVCDTCGSCMAVPRQGPEEFVDGQQLTYLEIVNTLQIALNGHEKAVNLMPTNQSCLMK